jgi:hypothetical protein
MSTDPRRGAHRLPPNRAFVVQFEDGTDLAAGLVGGRVEHVQSGRAAQFASIDELLQFVGSLLAAPEQTAS